MRFHERRGYALLGTLRESGWKFGRWLDLGCWVLALARDEAVPAPVHFTPDARKMEQILQKANATQKM